jgi:hypothetical protein
MAVGRCVACCGGGEGESEDMGCGVDAHGKGERVMKAKEPTILSSEALVAAMVAYCATTGTRLFKEESNKPKTNAQRNLAGRTHYFSDETLKWHKSRVCESRVMGRGLLHVAICRDGLDMHGKRYGYRHVLHDIFGTCLTRTDLQEAAATILRARYALGLVVVDLLAHYRNALLESEKTAQRQIDAARKALAAF